jgi:Holliday junction resolvase RusA-like endonuclease
LRKVFIPHQLTGLNELINLNRIHWAKGAAVKKEMTEICEAYFIGKKFKTPITIGFIWYVAHKKWDADNIASAKKFILDGMVKAGSIPNDNLNNITAFTGDSFIIDKENLGVEVEITEE